MVRRMTMPALKNQFLLKYLYLAYRSKWTVYVVIVGLLLLSVTAIPFLVTFDGHNYLAGSQVLFTEKAADGFWWLREPGYSMMLKGVRGIFGPSEVFLTLIQTGMTILGGVWAMKAIWLVHRGTEKVPSGLMAAAVVLGVGNASVLYYSSSALQQPFFVFTTGWMTYLAAQIYRKPRTHTILLAIFSLVIVAQVQEEFARLMVIPLALAFFTVNMLSEKSSIRSRISSFAKPIFKAGAVFLGLNIVVMISLIPWMQYRDAQISRQTTSAEFKDNAFAPLSTQIKTMLSTDEPHPYSALSHLVAFVGFSGSSQMISKHYERKVYVQYRQTPNFRCGAIEGMPESFARIQSISAGVLEPACRSKRVIEFVKPYTRLSTFAYPFVLSAGFLLAGINICRKRLLMPSLTIFGLTSAYCLLGFGADRYSVPLMPLAAGLVVVAGHSFAIRLRATYHLRHSRNLAN
jgi:hypothetical protein